MPSRRSLVLFAAALFSCALPCVAEDQATIPVEAIKFVGEKSISMLAGRGYELNCKAKDLDYASDDSWYCGLFATMSDAKQAEWKERVTHQLAKIREDVARINETLREIQEQQDRMYRQNEQILVRLNEVGPETIVGTGISRIRTDWNDQYVPLFTGERPLEKGRAITFAHQVIFVDRIQQDLGSINDQITHTPFGNDTLLRSYARRLAKRLDEKRESRIDPVYDYMEWVMEGLLSEQRKGFVMYTWAAKTLQANCEQSGDCKEAGKLPFTPEEYKKVFDRYVNDQLDELNAAVEWLVLARSDPHSRSANFLHPSAEALFARADLFTCANLGRFGVRGRVISMGSEYNGKIRVGEPMLTPVSVSSVATDPGPLDWWTAPEAAPPFVFNKVQFADRWKVYHYQNKDAAVGSYDIPTWFPYKPSSVVVKSIAVDATSSVPFGSFTAVERAGGGYALLSGQWESSYSAPDPTVVGVLNRGFDDSFFDAAGLRAGIRYSGTLEWRAGDVFSDQHIAAKRTGYAISKKKIVFPAGGDLLLHADIGDTYPIVCPGGACSDYTNNMVVARLARFKKGGINSRSAKMKTRAFVLLGSSADGDNGLAWEEDRSFDGNEQQHLEAGKSSARVKLPANDGTPMMFGGSLDLDMQTSGIDASLFHAVAIVRLENAYLTVP